MLTLVAKKLIDYKDIVFLLVGDGAEDMANKILFLYTHRIEANFLGKNGQTYVYENYSRDKIVQKLNDLINRLNS